MHLADLISLASSFSVLAAIAALAFLFILLLPRQGRDSVSRGDATRTAPDQARQKPHEMPATGSAPSNRFIQVGISRMLLALALLVVALSGSFASGWMLGIDVGERDGTRAVTVQADLPWQNADISVVAGQKLSISSFGRWNNGPDGADYGPSGNARYGVGVVVPSAPVGALVGRIGESTPFTIGESANVTANASGQLHLAMNDWPDSYSDNHGMVTVLISVRDQ